MNFRNTSETNVIRAIVAAFTKQFSEYVERDVIVMGGDPRDLMAGRELAF